jgi:hypothetical protein
VALAAPAVEPQGIASRNVQPAARAKFSGRPWNANFVDRSAEAGFVHPMLYGGATAIDYLVETSSGGVALIDFDGDGWLDVFAVGGSRWKDPPTESTNRLYRNRRDGTFEDVTAGSGLGRTGWASGVAVGDFDGDGRDDLFVTYWGDNALFRNLGGGKFEDVTANAGLKTAGRHWSSGASFFDMDRDGDLDLFVARYVEFDPEKIPKPGASPTCNWKGVMVACGPRGLPAPRHALYRNDGGRFTDVSAASGIAAARGSYGMTAVAADLDDDGWTDIYVACDSTPSFYFRNLSTGRFREEGIERGIALNDDGREQAGMGIGLGDYNLDGRLDIFKTHFADDTHILYRNDGGGNFSDVTIESGLAVETRYVGWGAAMADFDNDGWPDIFYVTGNVYPEAEKELPAYPYLSPRRLFRNLGNGRFEQIAGQPALEARYSSRGMAAGDLDNDGDLDLIIWNRNAPLTFLRNDLRPAANWLQVEAPLGTRVTVHYGGKRQVQQVVSQSSFYSAPGRCLHFGLGEASGVTLEIRWPGGDSEKREIAEVNRKILLARRQRL